MSKRLLTENIEDVGKIIWDGGEPVILEAKFPSKPDNHVLFEKGQDLHRDRDKSHRHLKCNPNFGAKTYLKSHGEVSRT